MLDYIYIENFLSIKKIEVKDLSKLDIVGIIGSFADKKGYSNGSGKSGWNESFDFAMNGTHRYKTDAEVIRLGTDFCKVIMEHINGKNKIRITRMLKRKPNNPKATTSTVMVELNGEKVT